MSLSFWKHLIIRELSYEYGCDNTGVVVAGLDLGSVISLVGSKQ